jgi:hypothetical protein
VIYKEFAGKTIAVTNFITSDLSEDIRETPFNVEKQV